MEGLVVEYDREVNIQMILFTSLGAKVMGKILRSNPRFVFSFFYIVTEFYFGYSWENNMLIDILVNETKIKFHPISYGLQNWFCINF